MAIDPQFYYKIDFSILNVYNCIAFISQSLIFQIDLMSYLFAHTPYTVRINVLGNKVIECRSDILARGLFFKHLIEKRVTEINIGWSEYTVRLFIGYLETGIIELPNEPKALVRFLNTCRCWFMYDLEDEVVRRLVGLKRLGDIHDAYLEAKQFNFDFMEFIMREKMAALYDNLRLGAPIICGNDLYRYDCVNGIVIHAKGIAAMTSGGTPNLSKWGYIPTVTSSRDKVNQVIKLLNDDLLGMDMVIV